MVKMVELLHCPKQVLFDDVPAIYEEATYVAIWAWGLFLGGAEDSILDLLLRER
jgi:hypothetical protein